MRQIRFDNFAASQPNMLAIVDPSGRRLSRGQLAVLVDNVSRTLLRGGCGEGDVLAALAPNCMEYMVAYLAATQIGMYFVPINWHLVPSEIEYLLTDCRARALLVHERFSSSIESVFSRIEAPPICLSIGTIGGFTGLTELAGSELNGVPLRRVDGRMLAYTSATTGRPKGVLLPLQGASRSLDMAIGLRFERGLGLEKNVNLCASMLYHGAALETVAISLHMGHTVVLTDRITPEGILQLIDEHRVTNLYVAPTMFSRLLRLNPTTKNKYSISSLTHVTHLGISCPVEVKRQMIDWWGAILWESYGAVEGQGTMVGSIEWLKFPGSVGRPIPGSKIIILSDDGDELPPGEVGTIYMTRYTGDRFEYLGDPDKTRAAYSGEFFSVGDLGYLNDDGYLFLCGRRIDMINVAGMNVYAAEIENVLALHPYVADCAVIGVPDEITGEAILALVQPAPDWSRGDDLKLELSRFLLSHLSPQKMPRRFEIVSNLARDATGKLRKKQLQAAYVPSRKGV